MEAIMNAITNKPAKINCPVLNMFFKFLCKNTYLLSKKCILHLQKNQYYAK